jgi:hypothetical protein
MKRIDVVYGGQNYSLPDRDPDELRAEILERTAENPGGWWMQVNSGEGQPRPTFVLVTAASDLALIPIPDDDGSA